MIFDMGEVLVVTIRHQERKDSRWTTESPHIYKLPQLLYLRIITLLILRICSSVSLFWFSSLNFEAKYPLRAFSVRVLILGHFSV